MSPAYLTECAQCGETNDLPFEALRVGSYRCHACGQVNGVPSSLTAGLEQPAPQPELVQTGPSYVPSAWNTPEAAARCEREAAKLGCLVALWPLVLGLLCWGGSSCI